jgi:AraC-like DNA-binding protein
MQLSELIAKQPVVPFIRESQFAIRTPWIMPERRLLDYLLIYVQEGECLFRVDHVEYHFKSGEFCLIQPNSLNYLQGITNTITPFAHFDIFFNPERENSFPTRAGQIDLSGYTHLLQPKLNDLYAFQVPVRLKPKYPLAMRDTFLQMVECWQHRDPLLQIRAQWLATEIVLTILEDHSEKSPTFKTEPQSLNWITSFLSFHLSEPLSVAEMAKRANLSPSRFNTLFKQHLGLSPHQYLLNLRIEHAKELLETTLLRMEEIASYCGFADIHHFSKTFKKMTGISPGSFRGDSKK